MEREDLPKISEKTSSPWNIKKRKNVSNDRTDYNTLIPVLEKRKKAFGEILEEVTADSGYRGG